MAYQWGKMTSDYIKTFNSTTHTFNTYSGLMHSSSAQVSVMRYYTVLVNYCITRTHMKVFIIRRQGYQINENRKNLRSLKTFLIVIITTVVTHTLSLSGIILCHYISHMLSCHNTVLLIASCNNHRRWWM